MNAETALTRLFGDLARYTCVRGAPLPDGSPIERGGTPADQDPRDADKVVLAGRLSGALYRVAQQDGGSIMAAALEAFFSKVGVEHQTRRLVLAIEDLEKRGVVLTGVRPRKPGRPPTSAHLRKYEALLRRSVLAYGACLHAP